MRMTGSCMKIFFISIVAFLISILAFPQQPEDSVFVIISGDSVHIWNYGAHENCGCLFRLDVSVSYDTIYVTEVDTASDWAYCMCYFDLCATITGLQSGTYFIKVFRKMPMFYPDTMFYIGSTSFIYGGSTLAFISQAYQSDCYSITETKEREVHGKEFALNQNYPNPFNPSTTVKWQIPKSGLVSLKIYDVLGREVVTLVNEEVGAGKHESVFDASRFSSGVYFYQLKVGEFIRTKKMILIR